jgi:hypothetical protein
MKSRKARTVERGGDRVCYSRRVPPSRHSSRCDRELQTNASWELNRAAVGDDHVECVLFTGKSAGEVL